MAQIQGINITSPVVPLDTQDKYATHLAQYGKGGLRTVADFTELLAIPEQRRELNMEVNVLGVGKYLLVNNPAGDTTQMTDWATLQLFSEVIAPSIKIEDLTPFDSVYEVSTTPIFGSIAYSVKNATATYDVSAFIQTPIGAAEVEIVPHVVIGSTIVVASTIPLQNDALVYLKLMDGVVEVARSQEIKLKVGHVVYTGQTPTPDSLDLTQLTRHLCEDLNNLTWRGNGQNGNVCFVYDAMGLSPVYIALFGLNPDTNITEDTVQLASHTENGNPYPMKIVYTNNPIQNTPYWFTIG